MAQLPDPDKVFRQAQRIYDLLRESNPHLPDKAKVLYLDGLSLITISKGLRYVELPVLIELPDDFNERRTEIINDTNGSTS